MSTVIDLLSWRRQGNAASGAFATGKPLERPRLEKLAERGSLLAVQAPAGYGKTVLLRRWEALWRAAGIRTAWCSISEAQRSCSALAAMLSASLGIPVDSAPGPRAGRTSVAAECARLQALLSDNNVALLIDDAHELRGSPAEALLRRLLATRSDRVRVAIVSRGPLDLGLSQLKLQETVVEIDAEQLCFDSQEIDAFVPAFARDISATVTADLRRATLGWPAMVTLALQVMEKGEVEAIRLLKKLPRPWSSARSYFAEQLLSGLSVATEAFLRQCGALGRFSPQLLATVLADDAVGAKIRSLEPLGLPLARDPEDEDWHVLHPLFASHLEDELRMDSAELVRSLHRKAAHWYAEQGMLSDAVRGAFASNDAALAAELLARASAERKRIGRFRNFASWTAQLRDDLLDQYPTLRIEAACAHAALFEHEAARLYADPVRLRFDSLSPVARDDLHAVDAIIAIYADRPDAALEAGLRGLRECSASDPYTMGTLRLATAMGWIAKGAHESVRQALMTARADHQQARSAFGIACSFALAGLEHVIQGRLVDAVADWSEADKAIHSLDSADSMESIAIGYLPETLYEWNDLAGAESVLQRCLASSMAVALPDMVSCMFIAAARVSVVRGEPVRSREILEAAEVAGLRRNWPRLVLAVGWERVRFAIQRGDLQEALRLREQIRADADFHEAAGFLPHSMETEAHLIGELRLEVATRPTTAVLGRIRAAVADAQSQERIWRLVRLLIIEARAHDALHSPVAALRSMRRALELGTPGRMIRSFVDEGGAVLDLVEAVLAQEHKARSTISVAHLEQILLAGGRVLDAVAASDSEREPLSRRELDVLRLLVAGLSNQEIGARLFVSQHTVKWHLQHVYAKLHVRSRTQAAAAARACGLIGKA